MIELKPCPFCGSEKIGVRRRRGGRPGHQAPYYREIVYCKKCGAESGLGKRPGAAVKRWNRRSVKETGGND